MPDADPQLSLFENVEVVANVLSVTGTIKDPVLQPLTEFPLESRQVLLVVGTIAHVGFDPGKVGRVRSQKLAVDEVYEIAHLADVWDLLSQVRREQEEAIEARMAVVAKTFGEPGEDGGDPERAGYESELARMAAGG